MKNILVVGISSSSNNDIRRFQNYYPNSTIYSISNEYKEVDNNILNTINLNINNIDELRIYQQTMIYYEILFDMIIFDYSTSKFLEWNNVHLQIFNNLLNDNGDIYIEIDSESIIYPFNYIIDKNLTLDEINSKFGNNILIGYGGITTLTNAGIDKESIIRYNLAEENNKYLKYITDNKKRQITSYEMFEIANEHNLKLLQNIFRFAKLETVNTPPYNPYPIPLHMEHNDYIKNYYHIRKMDLNETGIDIDRTYQIIQKNIKRLYIEITRSDYNDWTEYIDYISLYKDNSILIKLKNYPMYIEIPKTYPFNSPKITYDSILYDSSCKWKESTNLKYYIPCVLEEINKTQTGGGDNYQKKYYKYKKKYLNSIEK